VDDERRPLDPGLVAGEELVDLDVQALALGPPQVHAEQHLRPVLGFGATGTGVDRRDGIVLVVLAGEERRELESFDVDGELVDGPSEIPGHLGVALRREQFVHSPRVAEAAYEIVVAIELGADAGQPRGQLLCSSWVVPERRVGRLPFELGDLRAFAVDVKGTPLRRRCASPGRRDGPSGRSRLNRTDARRTARERWGITPRRRVRPNGSSAWRTRP
jgi:hypothetical protein